jgi:hypothetical protein
VLCGEAKLLWWRGLFPLSMNENFYELASYQVEALRDHKNQRKAFDRAVFSLRHEENFYELASDSEAKALCWRGFARGKGPLLTLRALS